MNNERQWSDIDVVRCWHFRKKEDMEIQFSTAANWI